MRTIINETPEQIGKEVTVKGWIQTVRKHGKIAFFDLYDRSGLLQVVAANEKTVKEAEALDQRTAVQVTGLVKKRGERYVNQHIPTGGVELEASEIVIVAPAQTLPFDMGGKDLHLELPTLL